MSEKWSDSGWKFVNEYADGRRRAEQPLPKQQDDEPTIEVFDETLDQETADRIARYAKNILADAEVIVKYTDEPETPRTYPLEATPVEDEDA